MKGQPVMSTDTPTLDINSDVGESYGAFRIGADAELFPLISSANVACGFHGGDPQTMDRTVHALAGLGVAIGAHPSYHDLRGFGRRNISATPEEIRADLLYQIGALHAFCQVAGAPLHHVKPHGALYNTATNDRVVADAIVTAVLDVAPEVILYALPGSELETAAVAQGLRVAREAFADRAYMSDGTLAPRSLAGAVLEDPVSVADRVVRMIRGEKIPTLDGGHITIAADTVCIHSDTPTAVPIASALRDALMDAGITVRVL
jgi:UPF0271 protein